MNIHPVYLNYSLYTKGRTPLLVGKRGTKKKKMVHQGNGASSLIQATLESSGVKVGIVYMLEADSGKGKSCKCTK